VAPSGGSGMGLPRRPLTAQPWQPSVPGHRAVSFRDGALVIYRLGVPCIEAYQPVVAMEVVSG